MEQDDADGWLRFLDRCRKRLLAPAGVHAEEDAIPRPQSRPVRGDRRDRADLRLPRRHPHRIGDERPDLFDRHRNVNLLEHAQ
jgi:hypothetical protein